MRAERSLLGAVMVGLLASSGCGGEPERTPEDSVDIGKARYAASGLGEAGGQGSLRPRGGVVEGEPRRDSAPPAAVESPRGNCTGAGIKPSRDNLPAAARATRCLLNVERESRGLPRLRANPLLARAALGHSQDMVRHSYFAHDSRSGATFVDRIKRRGYFRGARRWAAGENIGWGGGTKSTPRAMVDAWMHSPGHRANILQRRFREIGIGIAPDAPSGSGSSPAGTYTTAFGTRRR